MKRLSHKKQKLLFIALSSSDKMETLPEHWAEIIERLAVGDTLVQIAKERGVSRQAILHQKEKAIKKLGYSLLEEICQKFSI